MFTFPRIEFWLPLSALAMIASDLISNKLGLVKLLIWLPWEVHGHSYIGFYGLPSSKGPLGSLQSFLYESQVSWLGL